MALGRHYVDLSDKSICYMDVIRAGINYPFFSLFLSFKAGLRVCLS